MKNFRIISEVTADTMKNTGVDNDTEGRHQPTWRKRFVEDVVKAVKGSTYETAESRLSCFRSQSKGCDYSGELKGNNTFPRLVVKRSIDRTAM
jgi:hypothetical protein